MYGDYPFVSHWVLGCNMDMESQGGPLTGVVVSCLPNAWIVVCLDVYLDGIAGKAFYCFMCSAFHTIGSL